MMENKSKALLKADDSAAALLVELLSGTTGRNFDIESLFVERSGNTWRFVIFEFLKAVTVTPEFSHPNKYWNKNKRKFLSLWTLASVIKKAGYLCDLYLINYNDERTAIKTMKVLDMNEEGVQTSDKISSFDEWKRSFRKFNDTKPGDTWELLEEINAAGR